MSEIVAFASLCSNPLHRSPSSARKERGVIILRRAILRILSSIGASYLLFCKIRNMDCDVKICAVIAMCWWGRCLCLKSGGVDFFDVSHNHPWDVSKWNRSFSVV